MNRIQTKTGDIIHVDECNENDVSYGMIVITLKHTFRQLNEAEAALKKFLQQLQPIFAITHATGIDIVDNACKTTCTAVMYWQDGERHDWKVKGWTNGAIIHVLYIKNIAHVPVATEDYFFNPSFFGRS